MSSDEQRFTAWLERLEREHGEEIEAKFAQLDSDTAIFEACDHDWRPDMLGDSRHEQCAKCGWGRFQASPVSEPGGSPRRSGTARKRRRLEVWQYRPDERRSVKIRPIQPYALPDDSGGPA